MKAVILVGLAMALMGSAPPQNGRALHFIDTISEFDRIWNRTRNLPDNRRVEEFEATFEKVLPGFYSAKRVSDFIKPERYHEMILQGLKDYPKRRAGIRRVSQQFVQLIGPARRDFEAYFGPMRGYPDIYLVHSFGEFDGGTRDLKTGNHLMFGADMIDKLHKSKPIKPLVEHELFHLMHDRTFPSCDPVWCNLWEEGLATYVSAKLNPEADDEALGLTFPEPIRPAVEAQKAAAICAVRERLHSDKTEDYASLFYGNQRVPGFPPRMGYYVGYLVVQDVGRNRDLKQLAALKPEEVRPLIEQSLDRMTRCPAHPA